MSNKDPYEVLGVNRQASDEEIKAAYRELVKKYHPDKYKGNPLESLAQEKMQEVNEAYAQLTSRERYQSGYSSDQGSSQSSAYGPYGGFGGYGSYGGYTNAGQQGRAYGYSDGTQYGRNPYRPYQGSADTDCCSALSMLCCMNSCLSCCGGGDLCC